MIVKYERRKLTRLFIVFLYFENWIYIFTSTVKAEHSISFIDGGLPEDSTLSLYSSSGKYDIVADTQKFFQSFVPLFGNQNPARGHSRFLASFKEANRREQPFIRATESILGSGNFDVVKGGTYFARERDAEDADLSGEDEPYTYLGTSHIRVYKKNPPPAFKKGGDFFASFRDFADITAPRSKSHSHRYPVYVHKNASDEDFFTKPKHPKNIIEHLVMLDKQPTVKQSKFKAKLAKHQNSDQQKEMSMKLKLYGALKELSEPLLAVS